MTVPETISAFRWSASTCRRLGGGERERQRERERDGGIKKVAKREGREKRRERENEKESHIFTKAS